MNCAECKELLVVDLEGLLEESQKQAVREHLKTCETCRAELQGLQTLRQRLVDNGKTLAQTSVEDDVINRIFREQNARLKSAAQAGTGLRIRRRIMRSTIVKVAVAAVVVFVALGAWSLWSGTESGVALADVLAKVEQVRAFTYRMTMHTKVSMEGVPAQNSHVEMTALTADGYGMRMDMRMTDPETGQVTEQQMYILPQQGLMTIVMPAMKQYMRMEFDESMFKKKLEENNDPRVMIRQILDSQYQELGRNVIDGVEVEGFQTTDPAYMGGTLGDVDVRIWVDVKTQFPVRMDMIIKTGDQLEMEGTMYDFQWNVPVSADEFNPVLPADFTAGPGDGIKVPAMTEETALASLKLAVELTGKYPENLNMITLMQIMGSIKDGQTPEAQRLRQMMEQAKDDEERARLIMEPMMPLQMLAGFYATLLQEQKEPAYYGHVVQPGDEALVLLRWKTGENEYRVIFGDLHAETVDAETLAKLEAALPQ